MQTSGIRIRRKGFAFSLLAIGTLGVNGLFIGSATATAGASTSGPPVSVMVEGAITGANLAVPQIVTGAKAAVATVNSHGGVNGHPLKLITCDDQGNPNNDATCGQEAVSDHVIAAVGGVSLYDNQFMPYLAKAHIPYFGPTDITPIDVTSPISFPLNSSTLDAPAMAQLMAKNCKSVVALDADEAGSSEDIAAVQSAYNSHQGKSFTSITYPPATTDFTSVIATVVSKGADCVASLGGPTTLAGITSAVKVSGSKIYVYAPLADIASQLESPVGFPSGQLIGVGPYYVPGAGHVDSAVKAYVAAMGKTGASGPAASIDTISENAYQSVLMVALDAKGESQVTGPVLYKAIKKNMTNVATGLTAPFDMAKPSAIPSAPQLRDNHDISYIWTGSQLKSTGVVTVNG